MKKVKKVKYCDDNLFYKEMIISKGRGKLQPYCSNMFIIMTTEIIRKKRYYDEDDRHDCYNTAIYQLFSEWKNFNHLKYSSPFVYFTEICKRGLSAGLNQIKNKHAYDEDYCIMFSIDKAMEDRYRRD